MDDLVKFYLSPKGRLEKRRYWLLGVVPFFAIGMLFPLLDRILNVPDLKLVLVPLLLWPMLVVLIKRLHDVGASGWWVLLYFAPLVLLMAAHRLDLAGFGPFLQGAGILILGLLPGNPGRNRFDAGLGNAMGQSSL